MNAVFLEMTFYNTFNPAFMVYPQFKQEEAHVEGSIAKNEQKLESLEGGS